MLSLHSARASLYIYNTEAEVDAFVAALGSTLDMFGGMFGEEWEASS